MHRSVYARFEAAEVVLYDHLGQYRPANLKNHVDFAHYYDGSSGRARGNALLMMLNAVIRTKRSASSATDLHPEWRELFIKELIYKQTLT